MQIIPSNTKSLSIFTIACLLFLSSCAVITNQDVRPSIMEKAAIRTKCLNYIYGCGDKCTNEKVNPKSDTDPIGTRWKKKELEACMTHYQEYLRERLWIPFLYEEEYTSDLIEERLEDHKPFNSGVENSSDNES